MRTAFAIIGVISALAAGETPPPPGWGGNAELSAWSALINMTNTVFSPSDPKWQFDYYYDSSGPIPLDRYDHHEGGNDIFCAHVCGEGLVPMGAPCSFIDAADGVYIQWPDDDEGDNCCNCTDVIIAKFGPGMTNLAMRLDWVSSNNGKFFGDAEVRGIDTQHWVIQGVAGANNYFVSNDAAQRFVRFNQSESNGFAQWDIVSLDMSPPAPSKFEVPASCSAKCNPKKTG
jgi:hypothetical protein